jgi:PAC2 family.
MEEVLWYRKPLLSEPVAVWAFEGWRDAGNTARGSVENLSGTFDIEPFAELNSEGFYNYQMRRPLVEVKEVGQREFHGPQTSFYSIEDYKLKK